jgi:hypothetical protein
MPEAERLALFTQYTEDLKKKAEERKEKEEIAKRSKGLITNNNQGKPLALGGRNQATESFYFYNPVTVAFGKNEFVKTWGDRQLEDNWRWSDKRTVNAGNSVSGDIIIEAPTEEELYDPQYYISKIPTEEKAIDSLSKDRNFAYYQLGLIYKDKFNEYSLAKDKLQGLLSNDPEERLILPSKYNLYKIYLLLNLEGEAGIAKNDIISNHPDSRYAAILLNPEADLGKDEDSPENIYTNLYKQFENQEYLEVIAQCDTHITNFDGEAIVPKFEYLKAVAKARIFGFDDYKESINFIALNYPNSPEGKKAENMMQTVIPLMGNNEFEDDAVARSFKAIYQFEEHTQEDLDEFVKSLNEALAGLKHFRLKSSVDVYDQNTVFVVVHGFNSINGALGFSDILRSNKFQIDKAYFAISSSNYQIVQIHKNLEEYLKSQ